MNRKRILPCLLVLAFSLASAGPVSYYGQLNVSGNKIVGAKTGATAVQVRGVSLGWSNTGWESARFFNEASVNAMVDDWKAEVIRVPLGYSEDGGYKNDASNKTRVKAAIDAAIAKDVYVIIDWHSHNAHNELDAAKAYFTEMAQTYGSNDHVIFEIYNEPLNINWASQIKPYAESVITEIRKYSDNLILVGTPNYSQDVDVASQNKITGSNIAYVLHFYAATGAHQWSALGAKLTSALNNGAAVFVSEFGTVSADGNGGHDGTHSDEWLNQLESRDISYCAWQLSNKSEGSAFFTSQNQVNTGYQFTTSLSASGNYIYNYLRSKATTNDEPWRGGSSASSSSVGSSSSASTTTVIDDFEDEDGIANTLEPWYIYTDSGDKGASTVGNTQDDDENYITVVKDVNNNWEAKLTNYSLSKGENANDPYVAIGLKTEGNGTVYNLAQCTDGFSYKYKGAKHNFKVELSTVTDYAHYYREVTNLVTTWTTITVPFGDLFQPNWGKEVTFNAANIGAFSWEVKGGLSATTGNLEIDDFTCLGAMALPPKPESSSSSAGSSSAASSSSVSSSSTASSSSAVSSSSSASGSSSSAAVSSSSVANSSSSVPAESGFYYITRFNEGEQTAYGDYPFAFVYGDPNKVTIENEKDGDDYIVAVGGEGVLTNAKLVDEASYGAGAIGVKNNTGAGLKISDCTDGFSYKYKGAAHQFKLETDGNICGKSDNSNSFYKNQSASSTYKTVTVTPAQLATSAWKGSDCEDASLNLANVTQMAWELKYGVSGNANDVVSLSIDDVKCLGAGLSTDMAVTPSSSSAAGSSSSAKQSSSSAAKSSSSGSSSSTSSSSGKSSSSNGSSSSSGGTTPILVLSQIASANSATIQTNALNLQVTNSAKLEIYNLNGTKIRSFNFTNGVYTVSLADLPKGLYICNIQFNNSQRKVLNVPIR